MKKKCEGEFCVKKEGSVIKNAAIAINHNNFEKVIVFSKINLALQKKVISAVH